MRHCAVWQGFFDSNSLLSSLSIDILREIVLQIDTICVIDFKLRHICFALSKLNSTLLLEIEPDGLRIHAMHENKHMMGTHFLETKIDSCIHRRYAVSARFFSSDIDRLVGIESGLFLGTQRIGNVCQETVPRLLPLHFKSACNYLPHALAMARAISEYNDASLKTLLTVARMLPCSPHAWSIYMESGMPMMCVSRTALLLLASETQ